ncbi:MAG: GTP-binding protein [Candidatus Lokiarchaeota archaeon]|nr:GTP-binding protein [Candidatus Lokiarchaeota archaeon]
MKPIDTKLILKSFRRSPLSQSGDFHISLCGNVGVGIHALLNQLIEGKFTEKFTDIRFVDICGFRLIPWDISKYRFNNTFSDYSIERMRAAGMAVFDITNQESFENIDFWMVKLKKFRGDIPCIIVGNKLDKNRERKVDLQSAKDKAKKFNAQYIETSAKTGENVERAFEILTIQILDKYYSLTKRKKTIKVIKEFENIYVSSRVLKVDLIFNMGNVQHFQIHMDSRNGFYSAEVVDILADSVIMCYFEIYLENGKSFLDTNNKNFYYYQ